MRTIFCCFLVLLPLDYALCQDAVASVQIDCSAFRKDAGTWFTTRQTVVTHTEGRSTLAAGVPIVSGFNMGGVDLLDVLDRRCA
jgi:hypothetical protein